ncbi:phosphate ABC transporter ATP-binding protein [Halocatena pleomorpha]|uniref:Phosphate ABC transporter ATP-binding protein n=1 Tax=Halocatena pleomorpha TaxID=1785090 RepID=A0A3P3R6Z0_9EURY|nr:phosphate ABC transporter ATP-binding protein PstB [Halocatena pleomorpha]RRJ28323.1 phosphate ABC transporter ATP-binding protein [Halocatena pleomorpha]
MTDETVTTDESVSTESEITPEIDPDPASASDLESDQPSAATTSTDRNGTTESAGFNTTESSVGEAIIEARDINVWYDDVQALTDITMDIPEQGVTAMIGPSGCGKSTFLRCINRMNDLIDAARVDGDLSLAGKNVYDSDVDPVALRRRVGMVFQKPNPFPKSIYDNVAYGLKIQDVDGDHDEIVENALRKAALWDEVSGRLDESGLELSGGQQQRLCIARAIAPDPEVLLMDEPASALDPVATSQIEDLIDSLAEEYTVVIVTHNMQQAARISDKTAVFLTGGELVEFDDTQKIFENPDNQRVEDYITGKFG